MTLEQAIIEAVRQTTEAIVTEEIALMKVRVEKRVRSEAAQIAVNVCRQMDMQTMGDRLTLTLRFPEA